MAYIEDLLVCACIVLFGIGHVLSFFTHRPQIKAMRHELAKPQSRLDERDADHDTEPSPAAYRHQGMESNPARFLVENQD